MKNIQYCSRSRETKNIFTGIHLVFRGLKLETNAEIGEKGTFSKALKEVMKHLIPTMILFGLLACSSTKMENPMQPFPTIKDIPEIQWKKLAEKKIYFGHQSVGYNILDGIKQVMKENPQLNLNIVETNDPQKFSDPIFAHSEVGKNMDPKSKIDAFAGYMNQGLGGIADIGFFKFCFVDITAATDVDRVFNDYKTTLTALHQKYPKTFFVHFTAPLTTNPTGIKASVKRFIKKVIGRPSGYEDNIKRERYNQLLRSEFASSPQASGRRLFDLALFESTFPDGRRATFTEDGKTFYRLVPEYTNDGGHLNESGRKMVAEQLLIFLSGVL